jgi:hypothetical protein
MLDRKVSFNSRFSESTRRVGCMRAVGGADKYARDLVHVRGGLMGYSGPYAKPKLTLPFAFSRSQSSWLPT